MHANQLKDPISLVATLAHELAHVLLLGGRLLVPEHPDMEPLTEIATIFLGLGVIRANGVSSFRQWNESGSHGWRFQRSGYLLRQFGPTDWRALPLNVTKFAVYGSGSLRGNMRSYFRNAETICSRSIGGSLITALSGTCSMELRG